MGCIASKENSQDGHRERLSRKGSLDRRVSHASSLRKDDGVRSKDKSNSGDVKVMLTDKKTRGSRRYHGDRIEKRPVEKNMVENHEVDAFWQTQIEKRKIEVCQDFPVLSHPAWGKVPKCVEAEQVAAGWPSWLASVAGEAIMGWVPRRANTFEKLDRIGQGTYSNVYKARDVTHGKIVAIKKVRFDSNDPESVKFMSREILILRGLDHPNIIKLEGLITSQTSSSLYLVFEYMEHDLTGLAALPGVKFTEAQIKCYMQQLLTGLDHCHSRGVLHRDVKGSNLLIDDNGILKIADFGLASFFESSIWIICSTGRRDWLVLIESKMGCIASKENSQDGHRERLSRKGSLDRRVSHVSSLRKDDGVRSKDKSNSGDVKVMLTDKKTRGSRRYHGDRIEKRPVEKNMVENHEVDAFWQTQIEKRKIEVCQDFPVLSHPAWGKVPKCVEAEQVAAGWPSWLASVAGEAIMGWVPRRANTFEKLDRIGQGTYSNVYKARDVTHGKIVAIKKVRFDSNDPESVKFMSREILILRGLDHPNIIKLEGLITSQTSSSLYLVFEYMEHDLTGLAALPGVKFTEAQIKCYMQQLLTGLDHCHSRGVLHRDVKGSNLLIDDNGILKIADFGLASFFDPQSSAPLTCRVVTLWYRAPELLLGASRYGVAVDLWSAGCILGELYSGRPILPGRTEVEQLHKIFKLCGSPSEDYWIKTKLPRSSVIKTQRPYRRCVNETFKDFPVPAVGLMENLLSMDPTHRGTAAFALTSEFFTTKPFACDPSSLPKYPPSKEIDAKLRDEEARRQEVAARRSGPRESLAPNGYPHLPTALQKKHNSVSHNSGKMDNYHKEQTVSGFMIGPSERGQALREGRGDFMERQRKKVSHSGPLVQGNGWTRTGKNFDNHNMVSGRHNLSTISGLVATRTILPGDDQEKPGVPQPEVVKQVGRLQGSINGLESSRRVDQNCQIQKMRYSPQAGAGKSGNKEPSLHGHGPQGNKIYVSGPLLVPSNNMEQLLKEHDRQIQDFARRRLDKTKLVKLKAQGKQPTDGGLMVTSRH